MKELLQQIKEYVDHRPMILLYFDKDFSESLKNSRRGLDFFTFTNRHDCLKNASFPTLCLLETQEADKRKYCYLGVARNKQSVSTVDSRLTLEKIVKIWDGPLFNKINDYILKNQNQHIKGPWRKTLQADKYSVLTPKLSTYLTQIIEEKAEDRENVKKVFSCLLEPYKSMAWEQDDAVKNSLSAFGILPKDIPDGIKFEEIQLREDNIINKDAAKLPGFKAIGPDITGRFVHHRHNERVVIYVANRNPLEEMMGVDLIYINEVVGNIIMIQYKMLDYENSSNGSEWVFRPDQQFKKEVKRMKIPRLPKKQKDYRLNSNPFFFKFICRKSIGENIRSFVISLEHLKQHLKSPEAKGKRGGVRLTYKSLRGAYLRQSDTVGLLRSGYVGTYSEETEALTKIFDCVAKGDRNIVVAWKKKISSPDKD